MVGSVIDVPQTQKDVSVESSRRCEFSGIMLTPLRAYHLQRFAVVLDRSMETKSREHISWQIISSYLICIIKFNALVGILKDINFRDNWKAICLYFLKVILSYTSDLPVFHKAASKLFGLKDIAGISPGCDELL